MPTVLRLLGFRFFFYSEEGNEPPHIHVEKGSARGKYWTDPVVEQAYLHAGLHEAGHQASRKDHQREPTTPQRHLV